MVNCLAFAEVVISPNMSLPVPVVGTTPGPDWANNINSCMGAIDEHDHTPGHGVQISSSALNINSDLPLNGNSLTETESVVFDAQQSFSASQAIYVVSPDLIYNDGNGNVIRITQNGSVSGSSGTITGLPSGTASASFQSVGGTFQFQSATSTPANGSFASLSIAQQTTSPNTITLKSPSSLGASYNVTFPTSVPSFTSLLAMSTSGVLSTVGYKIPTVQSFTSGSGTYTAPTNPSPIYLKIKMVGGGAGGSGSALNSVANSAGGNDSTFGTALLTAAGGGLANQSGGAGGSYTINSPAYGSGVAGGSGGSTIVTTAGLACFGANGGVSSFGGAGGGGGQSLAGNSAAANSGSGGGGGGQSAVAGSRCGGGGGAAGSLDVIIPSPSATYAYSVGSGGAGGIPGGTGFDGGSGGSGAIQVTEYYQ